MRKPESKPSYFPLTRSSRGGGAASATRFQGLRVGWWMEKVKKMGKSEGKKVDKKMFVAFLRAGRVGIKVVR